MRDRLKNMPPRRAQRTYKENNVKSAIGKPFGIGEDRAPTESI
ncbi:hypothetical protein MKX31_28920 [Bacillus sp. FSL M8-0063]